MKNTNFENSRYLCLLWTLCSGRRISLPINNAEQFSKYEHFYKKVNEHSAVKFFRKLFLFGIAHVDFIRIAGYNILETEQ